MTTYTLVAVFGTLLVVSHALPVLDSQNQPGQNVVQGVFIPADVYKALQEKASQNQGIQGKSELSDSIEISPNQQPVLSSSQVSQPILTNSQPVIANPQPVLTSQPAIVSSQPTTNPQPTLTQPSSNGQVYVLTQQSNPSQPIVVGQTSQSQPLYISQPATSSQNRPILYSQPRTNQQPLYVSSQPLSTQTLYVSQPANTVLLQNGQLAQLAPANTQPTLYTNSLIQNQKPVQSTGTLYAVVPVQQVSSNSIISG